MKYAFLAAIISGFSIFLNKFAVGVFPQPLVFTALKNSLVGISIIALIIASGKWKQIKNLTKKDIFSLLAIGTIGGSIPFYLFFTGLSQIPAVNGAIIQKTLVIWVAILAVPILKEKLTLTNILAVGLLFAGNLAIGGFKNFSYSQGEIMVLGATLFWAMETIFIKKINLDPDIVMAARMGFGSLVLLSVTPISTLSFNQYSWIGLTAILLFAYVFCWLRALKNAPAITVTSVLVLSTLITNLLSTKFEIAQVGLMSIGVLLLLAPHYSNILISKLRLPSKI
ncbi:MAG: DMT family transporter [bacterium]|nr:DMT family transporter [bacterium]